MTEEEAKTKWCPFVRLADEEVAGYNRTPKFADGSLPEAHCVGSACMAWRWSYPPEEAAGNRNGPQGYCGLAGKP